jgi:pimeloyl-ACP methyl ester carboxylesterase
MPHDTAGSHPVGYDEFAFLHQNAAEVGLPFGAAPAVRRVWTDTPSGQETSALVWGTEPAQFVLIHGGAQNAHTWDTVALALDRPLVAIDLPGHGHSAWRASTDYRPAAMAEDVASTIDALAPDATTLVGMSLGGLTALATLDLRPDLADRLVLIDITPGVDQAKASSIMAFVSGPEHFASFDEILERTMAYNPTRSRSSLTRGVLHNACEQSDGTWAWRYDRRRPELTPGAGTIPGGTIPGGLGDLWDAVSRLEHPLLLVQGGLSGVVDDDDIAELERRRPGVEVVVVEESGHSVQGDRPLELAALLERFHC